MFEYILRIRTPITYTRANEVLERVNELIGGFYLGLLVPARIYQNKESSTEEITWETEEYEPFTWDNWEEDMKEIAKKYPAIEFRVEGYGENREDWWVALFKGDRYQIKYAEPPIDEWED